MVLTQSLGLHNPSAIGFLVSEGILTKDPPASSYHWETFTSKFGKSSYIDEELLWTPSCVVWSQNSVIQRIFRFEEDEEAVQQALFTNFPTYETKQASTNGANNSRQKHPSTASKDDTTEVNSRGRHHHYSQQTSHGNVRDTGHNTQCIRALVVILQSQAHIFEIGGTSNVISLPFVVSKAFTLGEGLLLQRKTADPRSMRPIISEPLAPQSTFIGAQNSDTLGEINLEASAHSTTGTLSPANLPLPPSLLRLQQKASSSQRSSDSKPKFCCIFDPLEEPGYVMASDSDRLHVPSKQPRLRTFNNHESLIYFGSSEDFGEIPCIQKGAIYLAVTQDTRKSTLSVWNVTLHNGDISNLANHQSKTQRHSSFTGSRSTGANTPMHTTSRQASRDVHVDLDFETATTELSADLMGSTFDDLTGSKKSSRRVSSLLAREGLSGHYDHSSMADGATRRRSRRSSRRGISFGSKGHPNLSDFERSSLGRRTSTDKPPEMDAFSMENLALDDLDSMTSTRAYPRSHNSHRVRHHGRGAIFNCIHTEYTGATWDESTQPLKCFVVPAPGPNINDPFGPTTLLLCTMNASTSELIIINVHISNPKIDFKADWEHDEHATPTFNAYGSKRTQIQDACGVSQGSVHRILILDARTKNVTLQSPWMNLMKVEIPDALNVNNPYQVADPVSWQINDGGRNRVMNAKDYKWNAIGQSTPTGCFDVVDTSGLRHRLRLTLEPENLFIRQLVDICQSVIPTSDFFGDSILRGWWDIRAWLMASNDLLFAMDDLEWVAFSVSLSLLAVPFNEPQSSTSLTNARPESEAASQSDNDGKKLTSNARENPSMILPNWLKSPAWSWTLQHEGVTALLAQPVSGPREFASLARRFLATPMGQAAIGKEGYLLISQCQDQSLRRTALASILVALHLYREELKLDILCGHQVDRLTPLLAQFGTWLGWRNWSAAVGSFYQLEDLKVGQENYEEAPITKLELPVEPFPPPSILKHLDSIIADKPSKSFPTLLDVIGRISDPQATEKSLKIIAHKFTPRTLAILSSIETCINEYDDAALHSMKTSMIDLNLVETLPEGIAIVYRSFFAHYRSKPSVGFDAALLSMIDREDASRLETVDGNPQSRDKAPLISSLDATRDIHSICHQTFELESVGAYDDSAELDRQSIIRLLFKHDQRFAEAARLLHPLQYPIARCVAEPGWSESDFLEAQQELAKEVATRTLSVSLGRGLLFFGARLPLRTEKFPIHGFTLSCQMKPSDTTVTADRALFTEEKVSWAFFHAGVEAGLSISKAAKNIDSSWILFNKPRELTNRHAGFLLALGLNGHLKNLARWVAFKYLTPKHNMTSTGLLLGLAASKIGTMDSLVTRLLSVHVSRMLPPGAAELNLSPLTQTCGIMGIGLLYHNTQHRRMSEMMLSEMESIDQPDGDMPMETVKDEGYRLAAGFALGFINLGHGSRLQGMHDMKITERLLSLSVAQKHSDRGHIADKATAGAIISLALIFMKTGDAAVARKIDIPQTPHQYEYVRPDYFLLRTVAKLLIQWDSIGSNVAWFRTQIPAIFRSRKMSSIAALSSEDLPYYNVVTGLCLGLGLRFAGSGASKVRDILITFLDQFLRICRLQALNYDAKLAQITARNCQDTVALAVACIMAGTGDLVVLRRLRALHGRVDAETPYGSHLAGHFGIGILFLGGGTHTFGTTPLAIASLLCAFYPLFPSDVQDNKSHLQAFRHLWVLATENRCLVPRDIYTDRPISIKISITAQSGEVMTKLAPCHLPALNTIQSIDIDHPDYWPLKLDFVNSASGKQHLEAFNRHQSMFLRRRGPHDASSLAVFSNTIKTLNDSQVAQQLRHQPFEWLFSLPAFKSCHPADYRSLIPLDFSGIAEDMFRFTRGDALDDRLVIQSARLDDGRATTLWNLKLLVDWADRCDREGRPFSWLSRDVFEELKARLMLHRQ